MAADLPVVVAVVRGPCSDDFGRAGQSDAERSVFCRPAFGSTMAMARVFRGMFAAM